MKMARADYAKVTPQHPAVNYRKGLAIDTELTGVKASCIGTKA